MDPPLCSSRACLHTAFIAFSVHCVFDQWMFHWLIVLLPTFPDLGKRQGAFWFRALTPGHVLGLVHSRWWRTCGGACWLAVILGCAGLRGPHSAAHLTFRFTGAWGGTGEG